MKVSLLFFAVRLSAPHFFRQLPAFAPPNPVDMTLKVSVVYQLSKDKLLKCRNSAGIETQLICERIYKVSGQYHVSDTQRRRNGF